MKSLRQYSLSNMKELKREELSGLRNLLARCIAREKEFFRLEGIPAKNGIIAEIKCASPSKGEIQHVDAAEQAQNYRRGGACAISVITDGNFFGGCWSALYQAANGVQLPILCKEFIFFEEQIDVAWMLGADLVLLIARTLESERLKELFEYAVRRGIVPLVEVHHPDELDSVLALHPSHLLVNARNLETLKMETDVALSTWSKIPKTITPIWASGIESREDMKKIKEATGARLFLVGTALMQAEHPEKLLKELCDVC